MALDQAARNKIAEHAQKTWRSPGCLLCGCTTWEVHGYVTLIVGNAPGPGGDEGLPSAALVCQRCGNTVIVNLVVADAMPTAY